MNNKFIYFSLIVGCVGLFLLRTKSDSSNIKICISKVVEHPALNATVKGIIEELVDEGFCAYKTCEVLVDSAQGQVGLASQIAAKFMSQRPTVVVGVGTLSAQSFLKYNKKENIPLIFSSVTDPIGAQLLDAQQKSATPIYGVSNFVPLEPQLELFKTIQPGLQKLGIMYNPSELNSVSIVTQLQKLCPLYGIQLVSQVLTTTADAMQVATFLSSQVDAIFINNDNTALSALRTIIAVADKAKIPTYVSDTDAVKFGALAALGPNQYELGRQTGIMIAKLLRKEPVTQQLEYPLKIECYLNMEAAQRMGIVFSEELIERADFLIQGDVG